MAQNISQFDATGSYSDGSKTDLTTQVTWSVSDTSIVTVGTNTGFLSMTDAGKIWGGTIGLTATLAPGTPGTASVVIVASDSGSMAPRMPLSDDQWVALGLSPWGSYWGCQEPTGTLISSGSFIVPLTASVPAGGGMPISYKAVEPGWIRNFISITGSNGGNFTWAPATVPRTDSSIAFLGYAHIGLSNLESPIVGSMRTNALNAMSMCTDYTHRDSGMVAVDLNAYRTMLVGPILQDHSDRVHPYLLVISTGSQVILAATDISVIVSSSVNSPLPITNDQNGKGFGGATSTIPSGTYGYFAVATGSLAESLATTSGAADFLSRLGWAVTWKDCPVDSGSIKLPFLPMHWESLGLVPWTATWNFQDTIGNINSFNVWEGTDINGWTATPTGIDGYGYDLSAGFTKGWTRRGIRLSETISHRVILQPDAWPGGQFDPTGSFAMIGYGAWVPPSTTRMVLGVGSSAGTAYPCCALGGLSAGGLPISYAAGATATGSQNLADGKVHPFMLVYDKTNSRMKIYTDLEKLTGSFAQITPPGSAITGSLAFGGFGIPFGNTPVTGTFVYGSFCTGALAESFSDDGVASHFLKSLGWTIPW